MHPERNALEALTRILSADLTGASMDDLIELLDAIDKIEVQAKGRVVELLRETTGASWPALERATGRPHSTLRFWHQQYLATQKDQ